MNDNVYKILNGINLGDQIGGPFDLASVLVDCIKKNNKFNKEDLCKKYLNWWKNGAFIQDQHSQVYSLKLKMEWNMMKLF